MGQASNNQTSRACYRQEIQNGTVYPAGWMSAMETFERKNFFSPASNRRKVRPYYLVFIE